MGMMSKAKKQNAAKPESPAYEAAEPPEEEAAESPAEEKAEHPEPEGDEGQNPTAPSDDDGDEGGGEDLPPALQPEYKRCVAALYEIMYNNDATSRNVLDSLDHTSDQGKVESVARTTMLLMHLLDQKLDMSGDVLPYVLLTVVDRLIELLERVHKVPFSDKDVMVTCAAAFEGAKALFPNEQTGGAAPGADVDAGPDSGPADTGNGAAPGAVPPGASAPAPEPAEAPEAAPTEEEVAQ